MPQGNSFAYDEEEEEPGFFRRSRVALCIVFVLAAAGIPFLIKLLHGAGGSAPRRAESISMVKLLPLPPPPPPPPPPPEQQTIRQPDMVPQTPMNEPESKPKAPDEKPAAKADAPAPLGTNIKGDGPDGGFNLGSGNGLGGNGMGGAGGGGSRWGWYAAQVQAKIADALRSDPRTRDAALHLKVRIWPDLTGRITRAQVEGSPGDAAVDQVLTGLQLQEPPPDGMPSPIVLRLTALRPN